MKSTSIFLILFGLLVIIFPDLIAYMIGFFFLFLGIVLLAGILMSERDFKKSKKTSKDYEFFGYRITKK